MELGGSLFDFYKKLGKGEIKPCCVLNELGETVSVYPFTLNGEGIKQYQSISAALDSLYVNSDKREWAKRHGASARKILQNNIERCEKSLRCMPMP